jgi:ATP-dependent exoDNAse (exonuclease V) alpha subunit
VRAFGEAVFEIIEQEPGRLREVTGIGPKRAGRVVAGWAEQKVIREIMLFLHSNGDLGVVSRIDMEEGELSVDFDGRNVTYGFGELDELMLAYATTIHKSQGSEYPAVVIPLTTQHYPMLRRNLVYTGVTRGKRLVVLVGQRKALAIAVKGARTRRRWSKLREWLGRQAPVPLERQIEKSDR